MKYENTARARFEILKAILAGNAIDDFTSLAEEQEGVCKNEAEVYVDAADDLVIAFFEYHSNEDTSPENMESFFYDLMNPIVINA